MPAASSAAISLRRMCEHGRIFVAHIEIDALGLDAHAPRSARLRACGADRARGRQRSLKVPGSPSSPLIDISRGAGKGADDLPFLAGRKPAPPRPRRPASCSVAMMRIGRDRAGAHLAQKLIAARRPVGVEPDVGRDHDLGIAGSAPCASRPSASRVVDLAVADAGGRRPGATADAGRAHDAHGGGSTLPAIHRGDQGFSAARQHAG